MAFDQAVGGMLEQARPHLTDHHSVHPVLQRVADELVRRSGFARCLVRVARSDEVCEVVAFTGGGDCVGEPCIGSLLPSADVVELARCGVAYGSLVFVADEWRGRPGAAGSYAAPAEPRPWRAGDVLLATVRDDAGQVRAAVVMDTPRDGLRPTPGELVRLSGALSLPLGMLLSATENERLAHLLRVADDMRRLIRGVDHEVSLAQLLELVRERVGGAFDAVHVDLHLGPTAEDPGFGDQPVTGALIGAVHEAARTAWREHGVVVVDGGRVRGGDPWEAEVADELGRLMREQGLGVLVLVPVGVGERFLGLMGLGRGPDAARWSDSESLAAVEVGRDLGRAVLNARAHEREQRLRAELERIDEYRSQLISTISHELKNPIGVIQGHLELVREVARPEGPHVRSWEAISRGARRLETLADDLLVLSRVADPDQPMTWDQVDLGVLAREVTEFEQVTAARAGVRLAVEVIGDVRVPGDPEALRLVLSNLVSNALKYSDPGGCVRLHVERRADRVQVECEDQGIGISEEDQQGLFAEFFRSTNPSALARPGTGLGLVILKRVVARHRGFVEVQSRLGEGTTVRVTLPVPPAAGSGWDGLPEGRDGSAR